MPDTQLEKSELGIKSVIAVASVIIMAVAGFYNYVVLPIQKIEITLASLTDKIGNYEGRISKLESGQVTQDRRIDLIDNKLGISTQ